MKRFIAKLLIFSIFVSSMIMTAPQEVNAADDVVIVLDPGHDSKHTGAYQNGLREHELTLKIAQYCYDELTQYRGVKVYMTRTEAGCAAGSGANTETCLDYRAEFAKSKNADALISFHLNSNSSTSPYGAEIYYPTTNYDMNCHNVGKGLATAILDNLGDLGLRERGIYAKSSTSRVYPDGSAGDYYRVIREAKHRHIPALIIEHAYMSNINDVNNFLNTDDKLKALGVADATAIAEYFGLLKDFGYRWTTLGASEYNIGTNVSFYYAVNEAATVTVEVFDGANNYIKTLESGKKVQTNDQVAQWDLKKSNGKYVKDGTYRFTITAVNDEGKKIVAHKWFKVVGNVPLKINNLSVEPSSVKLGENAQLSCNISRPATLTVEIYDGDNNYLKTIVSNKEVKAGNQNVKWDLTNAKGQYVKEGTYRFTVIATDEDGERIVSHTWFKVSGKLPYEYKWAVLDNSSVSMGQTAKLYYAVNRESKVTVEVFDGDNNYLKTLEANKSIKTNDQVAVWDLTDQKGNQVTDGTYRFTITATNEWGEKIVTHKWFKVTGNPKLALESVNVLGGNFKIGQKAVVEYKVNKASYVTVELFDGDNNYMKTIEYKVFGSAQSASSSWDIKDASGNPVKDGTYRFTITATTESGEKVVTHKWFKVTGNP